MNNMIITLMIQNQLPLTYCIDPSSPRPHSSHYSGIQTIHQHYMPPVMTNNSLPVMMDNQQKTHERKTEHQKEIAVSRPQ